MFVYTVTSDFDLLFIFSSFFFYKKIEIDDMQLPLIMVLVISFSTYLTNVDIKIFKIKYEH
jgi:hypothetical protein